MLAMNVDINLIYDVIIYKSYIQALHTPRPPRHTHPLDIIRYLLDIITTLVYPPPPSTHPHPPPLLLVPRSVCSVVV